MGAQAAATEAIRKADGETETSQQIALRLAQAESRANVCEQRLKDMEEADMMKTEAIQVSCLFNLGFRVQVLGYGYATEYKKYL